MLVTARAFQGAFGALLAPAALSILSTTFSDPKERGKAFGVYGASWAPVARSAWYSAGSCTAAASARQTGGPIANAGESEITKRGCRI